MTAFPSSFPLLARVAPTVALAWSLALPASAAGDAAAARALFGEARQLMDSGDYTRACPKLRESLRLDAGMGTRFNLAHCLENLGQTASAWALFLDVAAAARATNQQQRERVARRRAQGLEKRLSRLQVRVVGAPAGAELQRDGLVVGRAAWGSAIPVDPGRHEVSLRAEGFESYVKELTIEEGQKLITLDIPPMQALAVQAQAEPPNNATVTQSVEHRGLLQDGGAQAVSATEIAGLTLGGLAVVAAAAGTIYQLDVNAANDQLATMCQTPNPAEPGNFLCDSNSMEKQQFDQIREDAKPSERKALLLFGLGGTLLLGGAVTYFWDDLFGREAATEALQLKPWLGQGPVGIGVTGTF